VSARDESSVITVDGSRVHCLSETVVPVAIEGTVLWISCIVAERLQGDVEVILGMDIIARFDGVVVRADRVTFFKDAGTETTVTRQVESPRVSGRKHRGGGNINHGSSYDDY